MGTEEAFFHSSCPRCKKLRLTHVRYLGIPVSCRGCGHPYTAKDCSEKPCRDSIRFDLEFNQTDAELQVFGEFDLHRPR
jgi:hypothetical protein